MKEGVWKSELKLNEDGREFGRSRAEKIEKLNKKIEIIYNQFINIFQENKNFGFESLMTKY